MENKSRSSEVHLIGSLENGWKEIVKEITENVLVSLG